MDVLSVVADEVEIGFTNETEPETVREYASTIAFDIMLEYDVCPSTIFETKQSFEHSDNSQFLTTVKREGRAYVCE